MGEGDDVVEVAVAAVEEGDPLDDGDIAEEWGRGRGRGVIIFEIVGVFIVVVGHFFKVCSIDELLF